MSTNLKFTRSGLGTMLTSRLITVNSERLYSVTSACRTLELFNYGDYTLYFGMTNVTTNSGGFIASYGSKVWDNIKNTFRIYLSSGSSGLTNQVMAQEYQ